MLRRYLFVDSENPKTGEYLWQILWGEGNSKTRDEIFFKFSYREDFKA